MSSDSQDSVEHGFEWPAKESALQAARTFLQECAAARSRTLMLPDKDADGLCASLIIYRTLLALGLPSDMISTHFVTKGSNVHTESERVLFEAYKPQYVIVVDQGSRRGDPLVRGKGTRTLLVDHHWTNSDDDFPQGALILSAARHPPVATSSALAYMLCRPFVPSQRRDGIDYLCVMGTYGDLGASFVFGPGWPNEEIQACIRRCTKKALLNGVVLLNAPRRTATYDVQSAWTALLKSKISPAPILEDPRLKDARKEVNEEVSRVSRNRPWFSGDGRVALIRVTSSAQIHPMIATRWSYSLTSTKLEVVMCANDGYLPGMTNFSCRVAKCAKDRLLKDAHETCSTGQKRKASAFSPDDEVDSQGINIIEILKDYAGREDGLIDDMGENFARGHKQASGGIVNTEYFERLWVIMQTSSSHNEDSKVKRQKKPSAQKNTLEGWLIR
ncbi:DHH phosphoesterase [Trametopsis cervina]|nr:DHH phosphoesterase [Trametopsis cervina]